MIRWALFSTLASGLFYGLYCLTLRSDRWLQLSRTYLLVTLTFSLMYPLIRLPEVELPPIGNITLPTVELPSTPPTTEVIPAVQEARRDVYLPIVAYLIGVVLTFSVLALQVARTAMAIRKMPSQGNRLHLLDDDTPPCSFFNHIIIGTRDLTEDQLQHILSHERLHVSQRHTLDLLATRLMCCAAWFNPFAWLYVRELRAVHEYLADGAVLASYGYKTYLSLLYSEATGLGYGHITNNFQSINLKKRIAMMNRKKTRFGAWKVLAALPVAALLMLVGCRQAPIAEQNEPVETGAVGEIVDEPDTFPEFVGGSDSLYHYLATNIHYPEQAKKDGVQGRVLVGFVVEADGNISEAKVLRGIGGGCNEEALRVVKAMPRWKSGTKDGKPVRVQYTIPITFKLNEQDGN